MCYTSNQCKKKMWRINKEFLSQYRDDFGFDINLRHYLSEQKVCEGVPDHEGHHTGQHLDGQDG